ncbi:Peptidase M15 [compost metagenome]
MIGECGLAIVNGKVDYTVMLSPNFSLRSVSLGAVVSQYPIKAQGGISAEDIVCNLKNLAENVLEPLKAKYPQMIVTSGFRTGSGTSQHLKGEAVDIQIKNASKSFYMEVAKWIKDNLPYDQFLFEQKSFGTRMPWLHISLTRGRQQRGQVLTFFNNKKYANGLVLVS